MPGNLRPSQRAPLLALGFVGLLLGVTAGLARLGYRMPDVSSGASAWQVTLMIGAFCGVVIALERAVAIGRYVAYLGPLLGGLGSLAIAFGKPAAGAWLLLAGSVVLLGASLDVFRRQRALFTLTLALGAACWVVGNLAWALGAEVFGVVTWWLAIHLRAMPQQRLEM